MRESKLEKDCRQVVEYHSGRMPKWVSPGNKGVTDRIILLPRGYCVFVEFKKPGGKIDPLQVEWVTWLRRNGYRAVIVESHAQFVEDVIKPWRRAKGERVN